MEDQNIGNKPTNQNSKKNLKKRIVSGTYETNTKSPIIGIKEGEKRSRNII